jgi:biotin-dependent carboxylase-like uncharacterized protein
MRAAVRIVLPGPVATVQDLGRPGAVHLGVPVSGVLDDLAHRVANWLVGNSDTCATLELTMQGGRMEFLDAADIALTGAPMGPRLNGASVRQWVSLRVEPGDILDLGFAESGCRAYLAISGGFDLPEVLGSRSTYLGGAIGGHQGRALVAGDLLPRGAAPLLTTPRQLPWWPNYADPILLRAIPGPHHEYFQSSLDPFFAAEYTLTPQSNRMGCRLSGPPVARDPEAPASIVSEPVGRGVVQVPADGQPIVLLGEQTIGGYTCIATVLACDLWRLGQARPGYRIGFVRTTLEQAYAIHRDWAGFLAETGRALAGP